MTRVGLLAVVVASYINPVLDHVPMTLDSRTWCAPQSWLALGLIVLLAVVGYRVSTAGRRLIAA